MYSSLVGVCNTYERFIFLTGLIPKVSNLKIVEFSDIIDLDEVAHHEPHEVAYHEPPLLDIHCLPCRF